MTEHIRQGATILTSHAAMARAIRNDFESKLPINSVHPAPNILPLRAYLRERWFEMDASGLVLLNRTQELYLWRKVILESEEGGRLLQVNAAARLAMDAWRTLHEYQLPWTSAVFDVQEDTAAFSRWSRRFAQLCEEEGWITEARIEAPVENAAAAGFLTLTPRQKSLLRDTPLVDAFDPVVGPFTGKSAFPHEEAEVRAAARWVETARNADPTARVGIVAAGGVAARARLLTRFFGAPAAPAPLFRQPVIHSALLALRLSSEDLALSEAGSLLRSPFLGRALPERSARAVMDAAIRKNHPPQLNLAELIEAAKTKAPVLANLLGKFDKARRALPKAALPSSWAGHLSRLLRTLEWPGNETLLPREREAVEAWHQALSDYASLDAILGPETLPAAIRNVADVIGSHTLPPRDDAAGGVQILDLDEALGLRFDFLWVMGCTADVLPAPPQTNPFLPDALQRSRGVQGSTAKGQLAYAKEALRILRESAGEIVFSWAMRAGERELRESPLLAGIPPAGVWTEPCAPLRPAIWDAPIVDTQGPALPATTQRGGTRILQLQAACPFRAFAELRLGAKPLESAETGLSPRDRGKLLHEALRIVWAQLQSSARLAGDLDDLIAGAVRHLPWQPRDAFQRELRKLESERITALVREWLQLERGRGAFTVVSQEQTRTVEFGALRFEARVDRVDRLPNGGEIILDYKTNPEISTMAWEGPRPDEPQLPAYAVSHGAAVAGVAFAKVVKGGMKLDGLLQGRIPIDDWRETLTKLSNDFASGGAAVDPKHGIETCRQCGLESLCRIGDE